MSFSVLIVLLGLLALHAPAHPTIPHVINGKEVNTTVAARDYDPKAFRRGVPFTDASMIQHFCHSQISWAYNWDSAMPASFPICLKFVPMLWGNQKVHTDVWWHNADDAMNRGSRELLSFNEPDGCGWGQACMSPQDAVNAYKQYMMPYKIYRGAILGAPAITNGPNGKPWLQEFYRLCDGCTFDFQPIHWYDAAWNVVYFKNYVSDIMAMIPNRGIWVTEFHGEGSLEEQANFLRDVMPWMDQTYWVSNYAYMMADPNWSGGPLVDQQGYPNILGKVYKSSPF